MQVRVDGRLTPVAPFDPETWTLVRLSTSADTCTVATGDGASITLPFPTESDWLFLGQGYLEDLVPASLAFGIDIATVRSRVLLKTPR